MRQVVEKTKQRLGGFLQTDIDYLLSGGSALLAGQFSSLFFSFLLSIAFAHYLLPETYGVYKYILSLSGLIWMLSLSGSGTAVVRAIAKGFEGSYLQAFWMNLKWNAFISLVCAGAAGYYFFAGNTILASGLLVAAIFSPIIKSAELYGPFLNGKKEFKKASIATGLRGFITAAVLLSTLAFARDPVILVLAFFIANAAITAATFLFTIFFMRPNKEVDPESSSLAKHTSVMKFFAGVAESIDNILVFHYLGAAELALYSFIVLIPNQVTGMTKHLMTLAIPKFAERERSLVQKNLFRKSFMVFLALFAVFLAYVLSAHWIFATFFPRYMDAVFYSQVYALIVLANGVFSTALLDARVAIFEKYKLTTLSVAIKIVLIFTGVYYFGLWGLILGRILSKTINMFLVFWFAKNL